jgi:hypothetical protein
MDEKPAVPRSSREAPGPVTNRHPRRGISRTEQVPECVGERHRHVHTGGVGLPEPPDPEPPDADADAGADADADAPWPPEPEPFTTSRTFCTSGTATHRLLRLQLE